MLRQTICTVPGGERHYLVRRFSCILEIHYHKLAYCRIVDASPGNIQAWVDLSLVRSHRTLGKGLQSLRQ